jgi:hypothetical protein
MCVYRWSRHRTLGLLFQLWCGNLLLKEREIPVIRKQGIHSQNGWARPVVAEVLPNGSILHAYPHRGRETMTTGDYRLAERQKGRTMQDIDKDFLKVPSFDRIIPTRERRYSRHIRA